MTMNKVNLTGRLTADPELKKTQSNLSVCSFSLAVKRPHTKETTDFVSCTAWRQSAEYLSKYARKGDMIGLSGVLTSRNYEDKNGNKRTAWEVQADDVEILTPKGEKKEAVADSDDPFEPVSAEAEEAFEEQLPF